MSKHGGAVLLLAMIFLLLISLIAGGGMHTSIMEMRMAANGQSREEALQQARGIASIIAQRPENFSVFGGVAYMRCRDSASTVGCSASLPVLDPNAVAVPAGVEVDYKVIRLGPMFLNNLPLRLSQRTASSTRAYAAAVFETEVEVDGAAVGLGTARVVEGVILLTPQYAR